MWMQSLLSKTGQRPINAIVDITFNTTLMFLFFTNIAVITPMIIPIAINNILDSGTTLFTLFINY